MVYVLEGLRNKDSFKSLFQIITNNASTNDFIEQTGLPRKRKAPQCSILHYVDGNQSKHRFTIHLQLKIDTVKVILKW